MHTLLSEHWHAVRSLRPQLRSGVQPLFRILRGRPWVLLHDPLTQRFHRVTPQVWWVLVMLNGRRTLDEVWELACEQAHEDDGATGTSVISQQELVQLMSSLHANDLLQTQVSPDAGEVFERHRRQHRAKLKQAWLNPTSMKLPLLHPDVWFERHGGLARALFSLPVLLLWFALVLPAAFLAWQQWTPLTENLSDRVLSARNVLLLWFIYPVVKAVHEAAHGFAVKAWGGTVREMGLMLIFFTPVPYVDASSSYRFPSKWSRATVAAAGIMAELALGAVAVYVWLTVEPGLVSTVAFNVILIAGVSTLVVNGNPLMRYDGYFIACDLLETPNLSQRATQYWTWLSDRFLFGSKQAQPPEGSDREWGLLFVYGAIAPAYRLSVGIGMIWFVASEYLMLGVAMALFMAFGTLVMPLWRAGRHLRNSPSLGSRRDLATRRSGLTLIGAAAFLVAVPMPFYSMQEAVAWLPDEALVRAETAGHVTAALVTSGQAVPSGRPLLQLESPLLLAELRSAAASVAQVGAKLRKAEVDDRVATQTLRAELASVQAKLDEMQHRHDALTLSSNTAGIWVPAASTELPGRYVKRGEVVGYLIDGPPRRLRAAVAQEDFDLIRSRLQAVEVRFARSPRVAVGAALHRGTAGAISDLVSPALGTSGGGEIAVDPSQQSGTHALKRVFDIELKLDRPVAGEVFGDRVHVRFDLGRAPLAWQWVLRLRQVFLARLNV